MNRFLLFFLLSLSSLSVHAQQYNLSIFGVQDGLGQSQVFDLIQDERGYIWMATGGGGVSRFDGVHLKSLKKKDGLADNYITSLLELPNGRLFFGGESASCIYNGLEFREIASLQDTEVINAITLNDAVLLHTSKGLLYLEGEQTRIVPGFENVPVYGICSDLKGGFWVLKQDQVVHKMDGEEKTIPLSRKISPALVNALRVDPSGQLWVCTYGQGVFFLDGDEFKAHSLQPAAQVVFDCLFHPDGSTWFCTLNEGVIVSEKGNSRSINSRTGLPSDAAMCLLLDDWKNIWIGSSGGGVARYSGQDFVHVDTRNGLPGKQVYAVNSWRDQMVMGVANRGLVTMNPKTRALSIDSTLDGNKVKCLFEDSKQRLWVGTEGMGIQILAADTSFFIQQSDGLGSNWVRDVVESEEGHFYIATAGGGITKLVESSTQANRFQSRNFNTAVGLSENRVNNLCFDQNGRLWYATLGKGIGAILDDASVVNFDQNIESTGEDVRSVVVDQSNFLWIGSATKGLSRMNLNADTLHLENISEKAQLSSNNAYFLQFDQDQHLWIGSENGVDQVILDEKREILNIESFGADEGYMGIEACTNASFLDESGMLWFGTVDGLSAHQPSERSLVEVPPYLRISNVDLFYESLIETPQRIFVKDWGAVKDTLVFTYEQNHLGFDFEAIHQQFPDDLRYQWYLEGYEEIWSPKSKRTSASYSNLAPGEYIFHLRSCVKNSQCTEIKPIVVRILSPFWQKSWFQWSSAAALVLVLSLFFWNRLNAVKRKAKEKSARIRLERDIIDLEQKALRLQMNPHFIFNTLNSIQGLIARKDEKTARLYLSKFSRLMRQVLENSREDLISLQEEMNALKNFLELEQFTNDGVFDYEFDLQLDAENTGVPPLLIQPFVENAIIHGVLPQGKGKIIIRAREDEHGISIEVVDDGVGRAARSNQQKTHRSTGLDVTKERLALLENRSDHNSAQITFYDQNPGTRVLILLPLIQDW